MVAVCDFYVDCLGVGCYLRRRIVCIYAVRSGRSLACASNVDRVAIDPWQRLFSSYMFCNTYTLGVRYGDTTCTRTMRSVACHFVRVVSIAF